jgi:hypothetical protein
MRRVRNFMVIGLLLMASACADTGQVKSLPDNPENRTAAAKRYMEAMPTKEMLHGLAGRVSPNMPEKDRQAFVEVMNSADLEKAADRITLEGLVKNFTVGELNAMTAFYGSPDGKSASKKFGPYIMGIMPQIQQEVKKAMDARPKEPQAQGKPETKGKPEAKGKPGAVAPPAAPPGAKPAAPPVAPQAPAAAPKAPPALKVPPAPQAPPPAPQVPPAAPKASPALKVPPAPEAPPAPQVPPAPAAPPAPQVPKEPPSQK